METMQNGQSANSIDLLKIDLGADSAEKDNDLVKYFLKSNSYNNLVSGKKTIAVGNRGVGKSALFRYMAETARSRGEIVIQLTPEEYSYEMLNSLLIRENEGSWNKTSAYSVSWQYLLFNLVFIELVRGKNKLLTGSMKNIYNYVRDNLKNVAINPISMLLSYLKRLEGIKIGNFEGAIKIKKLQELYDLQEIRNLQQDLITVLKTNKVLIFIDELDKGWDNSEDAKYFISGLIQASQKLNLLSSNLRVYVSVRQEIFDNIPEIYDDAQKIREDIEVIRWTEEMLLEFITLRIANSIPELHGKSSLEIWTSIFSEQLDYRNKKSHNYMLERTQLRPREFLQFCKNCLEKAIESGGSAFSLINYSIISAAEIEYSEMKTKDVASEYRHQYPELLTIFEVFRGKRYNIENDDLDLILLQIILGELNIKRSEWITNIDHNELKKILWQIGFIKPYVIGGLKSGRKSGSAYLGFYELQFLNFSTITRYQIHPAFWSYLNLKENR